MPEEWDSFDIEEHDEVMAKLREMSDAELIAALDDTERYHAEEVQTEIDRRLKDKR